MTTSEALQKLQHYCAYQERSPFEVKRKLILIKLPKERHEEVIATLMEENFLDEYRFAAAFTLGKLNQKHWAPKRIRVGLQEHRIPRVTIDNILNQIDPGIIEKNALYLADRWFHSKTKEQLTGAMQRRGYSFDMIHRVYKAISGERL
ncbi:MAG TPA: RecX family transcriptional regulator [Cryomorphaceae bacterium]|nr:RecX family transcriptional regulator [Cryomorphaceae bacterium]